MTDRRITRDEACMLMSVVQSHRSTCIRRRVGCVLINSIGHVLSTGFNGVPSGMIHCREQMTGRCPGAEAESGQSLDKCFAIHAETNALLQCPDVWSIDTAYCTSMPCIHCLKLLRNTSCRRIVYMQGYPSPYSEFIWDRELLQLTEQEIENLVS